MNALVSRAKMSWEFWEGGYGFDNIRRIEEFGNQLRGKSFHYINKLCKRQNRNSEKKKNCKHAPNL